MRTVSAALLLLTASLLGTALVADQGPPAGAPGAGGGQAQGQGRGGRAGTPIQPGAECPAGMTLTRPGFCQTPEFPPPTIVDYRPKSTLVTAPTAMSKAKFPVVDIHGHPGNLTSPDALKSIVASLDALNVRVLVSADNMSGERLQTALAAIKAAGYQDRILAFAGIDFRNVGPGWGAKASQQLEADVKAGALGVGEIAKSFGMTIRKADGSRLRIDDPELDPVWQTMARLGLPAFIHTAEPQAFFEQPDNHNERLLELSLFRDRRNYEAGQVKFAELVAERDNLFKRHPKTTFIMAHMGWQANELGPLSKVLDAFPNVVTEIGAVLYELGRQPRAARDFFVRYQDRLLFGKDAFQPTEYPYYWRVLETKDEYFDYYRDYHAYWKLYGMDLADGVLKKLYYQNALRVTPGLPKAGWPR